MKTRILTTFLILASLAGVSQKQGGEVISENPYNETLAKMHYWEYKLQSATDTNKIKDIIKLELNLGEFDELRVLYIKKSLTATHISFKQLYKGAEVFGGGAKVAVSNNNVLFRCIETVFNTNGVLAQLPESFDVASNLTQFAQLEFVKSEPVYLWDGKKLVPGWYVKFRHGNNGFHDAAFTSDGNQLFLEDKLVYAEDSLVNMLVFNPDPITPISKSYGGLYVDDNDFNQAVLDPLRDSVQARVHFENGVFSLESDYVEIVEADFPVYPIVTAASPEFYFSRHHHGFEQVNAYYHVWTYQMYLQNLGYSLVQYPIRIDAQGFAGNDNSAFNPGALPTPLLSFGEGGVDDAEDADVVVHEYGHAISHSAAPNSNSGNERRSLDEAIGDYFAVSYKKDIYPYGSQHVFNWDGHNEYWSGRTVDNPSNYCYDNISSFNNIYQYTTLFNAAMFDIWMQLGKTYTDKLQIEALYGYSNNMSYKDAALMVLDADSALTGGGWNSIVIWKAFSDRCILKWNDVAESHFSERPYVLKNTFAGNNQPLEVDITASRGNLTVMDMNGRLILELELTEGSNNIPLNGLSNGMYLLNIEIDNNYFSEKIVYNR